MEFKSGATQETEKKIFLSRIIFSVSMIAVLVTFILLRLVQLQIYDSDKYKLRSMNNTIRTNSLPATRGIIYDRNNHVLAENQPVFQLEMIPEQIEDVEQTLNRLIQLEVVDARKLDMIKDNVRKNYQFKSIVLNNRLTERQMAVFANNRAGFKGVDIKARLSRHYPKKEIVAHALGYVGTISSMDYSVFDPSIYTGQEQIGKTSIERDYERLLHGKPGNEKVLVNVRGRVMESLGKKPFAPGSNLILTIDTKLQEIAYEAMKDKKGAVVGIDPSNGEILILISTPSYDPNLLSRGMTRSEYKVFENNKNKPLFNRAIAGQYPPGSVIKPMLGLAGLHLGFIDPTKYEPCDGAFLLPNYSRPFRDWRMHGPVNLKEAIQASCDVYFYKTAVKMGINNMSDFLSKFNLGTTTQIDIGHEKAGVVPNPSWKKNNFKSKENQSWYKGETVIAGIGQGYMLTTPLQLAFATSMIANKGKSYKPHLVKGITDSGLNKTEYIEPLMVNYLDDIDLKHWEIIHKGMKAVINQKGGTAYGMFDNNYPLAGKTGSSQIYSIEKTTGDNVPEEFLDHGLFIGFAPPDNPKIALAIIVENGISGRTAAAPVAKKILDVFLEE
jgi:penicillin-binding protein 2